MGSILQLFLNHIFRGTFKDFNDAFERVGFGFFYVEVADLFQDGFGFQAGIEEAGFDGFVGYHPVEIFFFGVYGFEGAFVSS